MPDIEHVRVAKVSHSLIIPLRMQSPTDPGALAGAVLTNQPRGFRSAALLPFFYEIYLDRQPSLDVNSRFFRLFKKVRWFESRRRSDVPPRPATSA